MSTAPSDALAVRASSGCAALRSDARSCSPFRPARRSTCPPRTSTPALRGSLPISVAAPTLAEFAEAGLLSAFGTAEPVRYETNTEPHDHFRCRLCLRLFDLETLKATAQSMPRGFTLERIETRAEGTCAHCAGYQGDPDAVFELQRCAQRAPHTGVRIHDQQLDRLVHNTSGTALERAGQDKGARSHTRAKRLTAA